MLFIFIHNYFFYILDKDYTEKKVLPKTDGMILFFNIAVRAVTQGRKLRLMRTPNFCWEPFVGEAPFYLY